MNDIITNFKGTGINEVDEAKVFKKWNHLWLISQWHGEYTLIKFRRKDSPTRILKTRISEEQAKRFINELDLICVQCDIFFHGRTWKRAQDCK